MEVDARRGVGEEASEALDLAGRLGLAGRTGFYLVLVGLTADIAALGGPTSHQADSQGALQLICETGIGKTAVAACALGFVLFGAGRLLGAGRDAEASRWQRVSTAAQGLFYLAVAYVPVDYLAGESQAGSERSQQHTAGEILGLPGGRELVAAAGVVLIAVCALQIRGALRQDFTDGLRLERAPALVRRIARLAGTVGIVARTVVFLPIGVFLVVAAVQADPAHADGLDAELLSLSGSGWGDAGLLVVAAGLLVFAVYSAIETRYRRVVSAE